MGADGQATTRVVQGKPGMIQCTAECNNTKRVIRFGNKQTAPRPLTTTSVRERGGGMPSSCACNRRSSYSTLCGDNRTANNG